MPNDLETLQNITKLDNDVTDLLLVINTFPDRKAGLEEAISKEQGCVEKEHQSLLAKRKHLDETELLLKEKEALVNSLNVNLNAVKKNTEYALLKEQIAETKVLISSIEEDVLAAYDEVEEAQEKYGKRKSESEQKESELRATCKDLNESNEYANDRLKVYNAQKETLIEQLDDMELTSNYRRLFDRYQDQVIVRIEDDKCQGCFIQMTPETISKVMSGSILPCRSCGRILVR